MIGRGHVTFHDDLAHLEIAQYVREGILRMAERHGITDTPPDVSTFVKIADEIATTSAYVNPVRKSAPDPREFSSEVDLPPLITARQAAKILGDKTPHWARLLARQYGWIEQEVPIILMSRDAVLAHKLRRDEENKCRIPSTTTTSAAPMRR